MWAGFSCGDNYGWDKMNPDLVIEKEDLISSSTDEIYSLFKDRGITDIIYMGVHTNICVYGKPGGMSEMQKAGFRCFLARDLNDAFTHYNPNENFTPDDGTSQTDKDLQQGGIPCINMGDEFKKKGLLKTTAPFDYVRFVPWGKTDRPFLFEGTTTVTLTAPWLNKAQIHYTTDGSTPTLHSPVYTKPLVINQTERLRAIAFRGKRQISLASDAYYVKMPEYIPPLPDIYLDSLEFITNEYLKVVKDFAWIPVRSKSFNENGLRLRKKSYVHGLGMRTPCGIQFDLKPEYSRFVALAGVDENILGETNGRFVAMHCKVIFKIFVDGELMAESPVMCITQEPWRFDILIPRGSHRISITCMDANGDFYPLNYGDLVNAGFILDK